MADICINNNSIMFTGDGGIASLYVNKTGEISVKGKLVKLGTANNSVILTGNDDVNCIGAIYTAGVADTGNIWVATKGKVKVLLGDNVGCSVGQWAECGTAGYANAQASPAAAPEHFQEIGHFTETVSATGAGTFVLATIDMHFN